MKCFLDPNKIDLPIKINAKWNPTDLGSLLSIEQLLDLKKEVLKVLQELQEHLNKALEEAMKESELNARFKAYEDEEQKLRLHRNAHSLMTTRRNALIRLLKLEGVPYPEIGTERGKYLAFDVHHFNTSGWSPKLLEKHALFKAAQRALVLLK